MTICKKRRGVSEDCDPVEVLMMDFLLVEI